MSDVKLYRDDLIRAAMGSQGFTNESLGDVAGLDRSTISVIRNGSPNVTLPTLKAVTDALGLDWWTQVFRPKPTTQQEIMKDLDRVAAVESRV